MPRLQTLLRQYSLSASAGSGTETLHRREKAQHVLYLSLGRSIHLALCGCYFRVLVVESTFRDRVTQRQLGLIPDSG